MVLAPEPAWRGMAGQARRARSGPVAAAGAALTAVGIAGVALATGMLDGPTPPGVGADPEATTSASPSARPTPTPTLPPTPSPSSIASPTPIPTAVPALVPTVAPTVAPTAAPPPPPPQQTYTVQQGDTLGSIAQQFGTTVEALQAANGINDPNEIFVGQVLVIA